MNDLRPQQGETQPEFAIRYHAAMSSAIPNTGDRQAAMMDAWRKYSRDPLAKKAESEFGGNFVCKSDVPVFAEHKTKDAAGDPVFYNRDVLVGMIDTLNSRIEDTGDFPPLTDGHTPDKGSIERGAKMPQVLGYDGPFRLGMIGEKNPRWAIFADEWHDKRDSEKLSKLRRRSPEVWTMPRLEDRFFDPIAALGAQTPRLDMGLTRLCRAANGQHVEKYSAPCIDSYEASFPSSESVFVTSTGTEDRKGKGMKSDARIVADDPLVTKSADGWIVKNAAGHSETFDNLYDAQQARKKLVKNYAASQPSSDIPAAKAKKILEDGEVHGKPLTDKQRGMFGAAASKAYELLRDKFGVDQYGLSNDDLQQLFDAFQETKPIQWVLSQMDQSLVNSDENGEGGGPQAPPGIGPENQETDEMTDGYTPQNAEANKAMWAQVDENENGRRKKGGGYSKGRMKGGWHQSYECDDDMKEAMSAYMAGDMDDDEYGDYLKKRKDEYAAGCRYECDDEDKKAVASYMAGDMDDDEYRNYMATKRRRYMEGGGSDSQDLPIPNGEEDREDNYSRRDASRADKIRYQRIEQENKNLARRVEKIEEEKRRSVRSAKLQALRYERVFDVDAECKRCSGMTDDQFQDHLDVIVENYARITTDRNMPSLYLDPDVLPAGAKRDDPNQNPETVSKAQKYCLSERKKGNQITWADAMDHVVNNNGQATKVG